MSRRRVKSSDSHRHTLSQHSWTEGCPRPATHLLHYSSRRAQEQTAALPGCWGSLIKTSGVHLSGKRFGTATNFWACLKCFFVFFFLPTILYASLSRMGAWAARLNVNKIKFRHSAAGQKRQRALRWRPPLLLLHLIDASDWRVIGEVDQATQQPARLTRRCFLPTSHPRLFKRGCSAPNATATASFPRCVFAHLSIYITVPYWTQTTYLSLCSQAAYSSNVDTNSWFCFVFIL